MLLATASDGYYWTLAALLGAAGLFVLYRALLHDRSRGKKRCPKCWYDMSGAPSLTCSECGKSVKRERKLYKTRRHKRWAAVGIVLLVSATCSALAPTISRDGWLSIVPNTALILVSPGADEAKSVPQWRQDALELLVRTRMDYDSVEFIQESCLWDWQWRLLINRALDYFDHQTQGGSGTSGAYYDYALSAALIHGIVQDAGLLERFGNAKARLTPYELKRAEKSFVDAPIIFSAYYEGPTQWILGSDFEVTVDGWEDHLEWEFTTPPYNISCGTGQPHFRIAVHPPPGLQPGTHTFRFQIREYIANAVWSFSKKSPSADLVAQGTASTVVHLDSSYRDVVHPNTYPKFDEIIRSSICFKGIHLNQGCKLALKPSSHLGSLVGQCVAKVELLRDGCVVATGRREFDAIAFGTAVPMLGMPSMDELQAGGAEGEWIARFQMDPQTMAVWGFGKEYWPGVIEQPVKWSVRHAAFIPLERVPFQDIIWPE